MDPQPAAALASCVASSLAAHSLTLARSLRDVNTAEPPTTSSSTVVATTTAALSTSLSHLHALLLRDAADHDPQQLFHRASALDTALTGCAVAFACLDADVQLQCASSGVGDAAAAAGAGTDAQQRWRRVRERLPRSKSSDAKTVFTKEALPRQLRALRKALVVIVRVLVAVEEDEARELLREGEGCGVFADVAKGTEALWAVARAEKAEVGESVFLEAAGDGIARQGQGSFVDSVVNSPAYAEALAAVTRRESVERTEPGAEASGKRVVQGGEDPGTVEVAGNEEQGANGGQAVREGEGDVQVNVEQHSEQGIAQDGERVQQEEAAQEGEAVQEGEVVKEGETTAQQKSPEQAIKLEGGEEEGESAQPTFPEQDTKLNGEEERPPLPPREQNAEKSDEEAPPLPPRRPTASPPAVESSSTDDVPSHSVDEANPTPGTDMNSTDARPVKLPDELETTPSPSTEPSPLSLHELRIRSIWQTLLLTELAYITTLLSLRNTILPALRRSHPALARHLDDICRLPSHLDALLDTHTRHLLQPLRLQLGSVVKTDLLLPIFRIWCRKAAAAHRAYGRRLPHAVGAVRTTLAEKPGDAEFKQFCAEERLEEAVGAPVRRLGEYCEVLGAVAALEREEGDGPRASRVGEYGRMLRRLRGECADVVRMAEGAEELRGIERRVQTVNCHNVEPLELLSAERRIVWQGPLACKTKGKGVWNQVHGVLLDNYLFWGRVEGPRESWFGKYKYGERLWVLEAPMPVQQLECSFDNGSKGKSKASVIDNVPRGSELFVFLVKAGEFSHLMAAATSEGRQEWVDFIRSLAV